MKESKKQKNKYVIIYDDFREQGLTLEQAYIKGRVDNVIKLIMLEFKSDDISADILF